jgi:hypothetical protein
MLGKPPSINYQAIGYNKFESPDDHHPPPSFQSNVSHFENKTQRRQRKTSKSSLAKSERSSILSNDYDDLADFEGYFESRSTVTTAPPSPTTLPGWSGDTEPRKRRSSRGFFQALLPRTSGVRRDSSCSRPSSSNINLSGSNAPKLKSLRSVGSLRGSSKTAPSFSPQCNRHLPTLPQISLGFEDLDWPKLDPSSSQPVPGLVPYSRSRRSVSLNTQSSNRVLPASQRQNHGQSGIYCSIRVNQSGEILDYQASLANALVAASHSEASKGIHSDLIQILNHEGKSWGFTYISYPHKLRVWYGDKDERIAEGAVRWMERTMGSERCQVQVVKSADHSLMYRTSVIVEVLEIVRSFWD